MIKCCAFGTVRMDVHIYKEYGQIGEYEEVKVDEMALKIGGSVYNTVAVLNELKQDVVFYTLNVTDDFADFIKLKMLNKSLPFIISRHEQNSTAVSVVFVDEVGKKKMISYDGIRNDSYVLKKLKKDITNFDLFYTSFYEVNSENFTTIIDIMKESKQSFVDLSPLIYEIDKNIVDSVLDAVQIISGTSEEYEMLLNLLQIKTVKELITKYKLKYVFEKRGSKGAALFYDECVIECKPKEHKLSHNTTGCGDTFNAGIIYSLSKKMDEMTILQNAVEYASLVAYEGFNPELFSEMN